MEVEDPYWNLNYEKKDDDKTRKVRRSILSDHFVLRWNKTPQNPGIKLSDIFIKRVSKVSRKNEELKRIECYAAALIKKTRICVLFSV